MRTSALWLVDILEDFILKQHWFLVCHSYLYSREAWKASGGGPLLVKELSECTQLDVIPFHPFYKLTILEKGAVIL